MGLIIIVLSVCLSVLLSSSQVEAKPGAAVQFTRKGLNHAAQLTLDSAIKWILEKRNTSFSYGDFFNCSLSNITVRGLKSVQSDVLVYDGSGLSMQITNLYFNLTSEMKLKFKSYDLVEAELHISVINSSLYLPVKFGTNGKGQPTLQSTCQFNDTGGWSIQLTGKSLVIRILNFLVRRSKSHIVSSIENKICLAVSTSLTQTTGKSFSRYHNILDVGPNFSANYSDSLSAFYNYSSVIFPLVGEIFWTKGRTASSLTVPDLPPLARNDQMVYFALTDYVFNSLAFAAFYQKQLDKMVTYKDLPADRQFFLNTTCPGNMCLGKLIAQTAFRFPNSVAELQINSSERPRMVISPGSVNVSFNANIKFNVNTPQNACIYMFSIKTRLDTGLHILPNEIIPSGRVTAAIKHTSLSVGILDSSIGAINLSLLNTLMDIIVKIYIRPQLNRLGAKGIPLPNLGKNIKFKGPQIFVVKDAIIVGTDVNYSKDSSKDLMFQKASNDKQNSFQVFFSHGNKKPMIL